MGAYKTKPRTIQAEGVVSLTKKFMYAFGQLPPWFIEAYKRGHFMVTGAGIVVLVDGTLEVSRAQEFGRQYAAHGDYITCDEKGRVRAVDAAQFEATYELVPEVLG